MNNAVVPQIHDKLNLLETKIRRLIDYIAELSEENNRLRNEIDMLRQERDEFQRTLEQDHQSALEADHWKTEVQKLNATRVLIAKKIEQLLDQIDVLEMSLSDAEKPESST